MDNMTDALGECAGGFPAPADDDADELDQAYARIRELEAQHVQVCALLRKLPGFMSDLMLSAKDSFKLDPDKKLVADQLLTLLGVHERLT